MDKNVKRRHCKKGQIWLAKLHGAMGTEQKGVRPILVIHVYSSELFLAIPLTSKQKSGNWYCPIHFSTYRHVEKSYALLSQLRTLDICRLLRPLGKIPKEDAGQIWQKAIALTN